MKKYPEYKSLDLPSVAKNVGEFWNTENVFATSLNKNKGNIPYVFYEGPPSANGIPGIHHVMARTIKDIFCRYRTQKGFYVERKGGWDTHGLPIELGVEKELGITKEDIGKSISIEEYNHACREAVMRYKDVWDDITVKMGYWVDLKNPYITYENKYIETVWHLLKKLFDKDLIYKGYTIQPFSPKAGTGLSTHELNQPGCYKNVKDTTITAQFHVVRNHKSEFLFENGTGAVCFIAWTTTPWTLPSNMALGVGNDINYVQVNSYNPYTFEPVSLILAEELAQKHFPAENASLKLAEYNSGDKKIPFEIIRTIKGKELCGISYEQLLPFVIPEEGTKCFEVIPGDFVSTEDGTGIVHLAPTFGADDMRVAKEHGISGLMVKDEEGNLSPLVNKQGRFVNEVEEFAGEFVKEEYYSDGELTEGHKSVDVRIAIKLKEENKAFKVEKYEHSYPHCWRTDKPILYYPLDSWFVKTTAVKDRLISKNKEINWKPESTGTGRFGNWLENLQDWNLSRSRYWGIPLPIWSTEDKKELKCIGSVEELQTEINRSVDAGLMEKSPLEAFQPGDFSKENYESFDLHRPYADDIVLLSEDGKPMKRELDLIDVWFDSGSMPYAQHHYPFENKSKIEKNDHFPADFIAEGVDQTRGWFFTLHAIAVMCFDSVAFKNVVSNGLVLDKMGQKMSKRLGNAVDPFKTIDKFGPDATRWYMITNAQPWDNLKFDEEGIAECQRKFFRALYNTYAFFALYANIDGFNPGTEESNIKDRPEIDRWVISRLNTLIIEVELAYDAYEPTKAGRLISDFVIDHLSNWYVRLCRRRFWKGKMSTDKKYAYETLYDCLVTVSKLSAPIAPYFMDRLFKDLTDSTHVKAINSVHLSDFPISDKQRIDANLENKMEIAQKLSSLVLSLRKKENIRVRQPLERILVPVKNEQYRIDLEAIKDLILSEVNVKTLEIPNEQNEILVRKIKPNFKTLGPKFGKRMKEVASATSKLTSEDINILEKQGFFELSLADEMVKVMAEDFEISSADIPGWLVSSDGVHTVALDVSISEALRHEGLARELVNRIQNLRKNMGFDVTDLIDISLSCKQDILDPVIAGFDEYIKSETLARSIESLKNLPKGEEMELTEGIHATIAVEKVSN